MKKVLIILFMLLASSVFAEEPLHKEVKWALDWELPVSTCEKPKVIAQSKNVTDEQGDRPVTDIDTYTINRYQRKMKRFTRCNEKYKKNLMKDFTRLKESAQYGLTEPQAKVILQNMSDLQEAYIVSSGETE